MTYDQAALAFENYEFEDAYAEFLMGQPRIIEETGCGLTELIEDEYLLEAFLRSLVTEEA